MNANGKATIGEELEKRRKGMGISILEFIHSDNAHELETASKQDNFRAKADSNVPASSSRIGSRVQNP